MNAGEIEITVDANYAALEDALTKTTEVAKTKGTEAGTNFGDQFARSSQRYIDRQIDEISSKLRKAAGAIAIANAFKNVLEDAAEGADISTAITNAIKQTPIIGIFASIVESGIRIGLGEAEQMAKLRRAQEREREAEEALKIALDREQKISDGKKRSERDAMDAAYALSLERAKASGDKLKVIEEQRQRELQTAWDNHQERMANVKSAQEKNNVEQIYLLERTRIKTKYDFEVAEAKRAQEEVKDKQLKDDQERSRKYGEQIAKQEKAASDERAKADLEAAKQLQDRLEKADKMRQDASIRAEQDRMQFAQTTGSTSTSFGTFVFKGYTDSDKKAVDQSILAQVREINKKASDFVNTGIQ